MTSHRTSGVCRYHYSLNNHLIYSVILYICRHPIPYSAYFVAGSDREFSVVPPTGELLPAGTHGSLIKVHFTPNKYGKVYQGKLVVQVCTKRVRHQ